MNYTAFHHLLDYITVDPTIMAGKPVIRGTRLTVQHILDLLAQGMTTENILQKYKQLTKEDIRACLLFAQEIIAFTSKAATK